MAILPLSRQAINFVAASSLAFDEVNDEMGQNYCTPVNLTDPSQFEIKFSGADAINFKITDLDDVSIYESVDESAITKYSNFAKIDIDWPTFLDDYTGCLRLWIKQEGQTWEQGYKSQCLHLKPSHEGTYLINWENNEATFGFDYNNLGFSQYLRLHGKLWHPRFPKEKKNVFVDSAGNRLNLYSRTKKEVVFNLSEVPEYIHETLAIALEHDTFIIDSVLYVNEESDYSPNWRKTSRLAPSEIVLTESGLNLINAYCFKAGACDFTILIDYIVDATATGANDGKVSITLQYGLTFTYSKDNTTFQESNILTGLSEGENTIYVKDQFNCVNSKTITIEIMDQIGTIKMFGGTISGNFDGTGLGVSGWAGWALANGSNGTVDLRSRFVVGYDPTNVDYDTIGELGGAEEVSLTESQMPRHNHNISYNAGAGANDSPTLVASTAFGTSTSLVKYKGGAGVLEAASDGVAHENRPPYFAIAFVQRIA